MRVLAAILFLVLRCSALEMPGRALSTNTIHLGVAGKPEWDIFAGKTPYGERFDLQFDAHANEHEGALIIRQDDVKNEWSVELNNKKLGRLFLMEADLIHSLPIPPGTLKEGKNELRIWTRQPEDILLHEIYLNEEPIQKLLAETRVKINVSEERSSSPARITIVDENGTLAPIFAHLDQLVAARPGVVYTATGSAELGLLPGKYRMYATRGPEYSLGEKSLTLRSKESREIRLSLTREVPTKGWAACDTHIHTLELSGHGDSSLADRMLTIAGEGIELPICTEHNQHANYSAAAEKTKTAQFFTPIAGNEVTTAKGHFNIFPILSRSDVVDYKLEDWPTLMQGMRRVPGVQIVTLNHPTDLHSNFRPFAKTNFVALTGRNLRGFEFSFDAMEVINSGAMRSDWMEPYRAWFGLLNHGYRVTAIGASDSHDVSRFIVGQGRTYIRCDDSNPAAINVEDACRSLRVGNATVSLGLFTTISVDGKFGPGEIALGGNPPKVKVEVFGPSWMAATNITLFANGEVIRTETLSRSDSTKAGRKAAFEWEMPRRKIDYHLVAIATGPGVTQPYWGVARPYQPSSPHFNPLVIGSTNPIWVDADGDRKFSSPRAYAQKLLANVPNDPPSLVRNLKDYDSAVAAQLFDLLAEKGIDLRTADLKDAVNTGPSQIRNAYNSLLLALYE
jgi:hypothetical protein